MSHAHFASPGNLGYPSTPSPCAPIENAGIRTGEIIAWRCWRRRRPNGLLESMAVAAVWVPGEAMTMNTVKSLTPPFHIPIKRLPIYAGEGVHAFKTLDMVKFEYGVAGLHGTIVYGAVALWGEVIEHEHGYRAEFGMVHSIHSVKNHGRDDPETETILRKMYNVEEASHG